MMVGFKKWVMAYNEILAFYDEKSRKVMLVEDYGPKKRIFY